MTAVQRFREFKMPDVGEGLTEAEILRWLVGPGDAVSDGQVVCEVETAKAVVELPVPFDGAVHELRFPEGTTVDVGSVIITVDTEPSAEGTPPDEAAAPSAQAAPAEPAAPAEAVTPSKAAPPEEAAEAPAAGAAEGEGAGEGAAPKAEGRQPVLVGYGVSPGSTKRRPRKPQAPAANGTGQAPPGNGVGEVPEGVAGLERAEAQARVDQPTAAEAQAVRNGQAPQAPPTPQARPLAKPPVRKLARDLGIDLSTVVPTGPQGIVTREDVRAAADATARAAAPEAPAAAPPAPLVTPAGPAPGPRVEPQPLGAILERERRVPIKGVRKATAQAMVASAFTAPHVTEFVTIDVTRTMKLVEELKQDPEMNGQRVTPLLLVAKAFLVAIRRHPEINATWDEENQEIVVKGYVNLGIAAATPRGLIVPNIKDAGTRTLPELAKALSELISTAREGKTGPTDMSGGTVTITNIGVFGIDTGTPILNPGESAILGFGAVKLQPWVHKGKVKPRQVTTLALSFDHRLVDGELGSRVLADTAAVLENPRRLITWS